MLAFCELQDTESVVDASSSASEIRLVTKD